MGHDPVLVLPFDPSLFGGASNNGKMVVQVQPNGRATEGLKQLACLVTGRSSSQPLKSGSFFLTLLNRKAG